MAPPTPGHSRCGRPAADPLPNNSAADRADKLFVSINQSLKSIENEQLTRINTLADNAYKSADAITQALQAAGLPVDSDFGKNEAMSADR